MKTYHINKIPLNDRGSTPWDIAENLTDFSYPWDTDLSPKTQFRALHNSQYLYFRFDVMDPNIHTYIVNNDKKEVGFSDRVEIFLTTNKNLSPYYGLEIDSTGRVMDFKANYHRDLDFNWEWPEPLNINTTRTSSGYIVEGQISLELLRKLSLLKSNELQIGLFRANCTELSDDESTIKWISWVNPKTSEPDFHVPEAFGQFVFID